MINCDNYVDLLFVQDGPNRQVVEVPPHEAEVGDLVEYIMPEHEINNGRTVVPEEVRMGLVLKKMFCQRFDNEWSCITEIARIRRGQNVYRSVWSKAPETIEYI